MRIELVVTHRAEAGLTSLLHNFFRLLIDKGNIIMLNTQELLDIARSTNAALTKVSGEIDGVQAANVELQASVAALQAQLDAIGVGGTVTQELVDALAANKAAADALDAKIPDAVVVPDPLPPVEGDPAAPNPNDTPTEPGTGTGTPQ